MNKECEVFAAKMQKTLDMTRHELTTIRAGRANPAVLDKLTVEYFGAPMAVNQVAAISTPEPRILAIQPWDSSALKSIEKAILQSDLGINPQNDGKVIRLIFPQLTEERRKELIKGVKKTGEDAKVAIRNIRREAVDTFKKKNKANELTEDDVKLCEKDIQDLTDKYCKEMDAEIAKKEKELLSI